MDCPITVSNLVLLSAVTETPIINRKGDFVANPKSRIAYKARDDVFGYIWLVYDESIQVKGVDRPLKYGDVVSFGISGFSTAGKVCRAMGVLANWVPRAVDGGVWKG